MNKKIDHKAIGRKSKNKGKAGERELANKLKEYGFDCSRTAQYNGKAEDGQPDVKGLKGIHIECKRAEKLNIDDALEQADRDHKGKRNLPFSERVLPAVFHRKNGKKWKVTMYLDDWIAMYREYSNSEVGE